MSPDGLVKPSVGLSEGVGGDALGPIRIRTFYPADPAGIVPGGVDTFIRGLVKWAPEDLEFSVVGMTTDTTARPVGRWTVCDLGRRQFRFLPVVRVENAGQRSRWPLSVRYTAALCGNWRNALRGFDVFEFHRIEPAVLFIGDRRPKNAFFHQDMGVIRTERKADILWKHFPVAYFALEKRVVRSLSSAWCVRESGAQALRERYPMQAGSIGFVPTWVDGETFTPVDPVVRARLRQSLAAHEGMDADEPWIVSVGRLDTQKDPLLMLKAFGRLVAAGQRVRWLVVGDGALRASIESAAAQAGLADRVHLLGLRSPAAIADILRASDVYALSSAYEGMPMALLEALGCGLPVVTTDVGEVRLVVTAGVNGTIAARREEEAFAASLRQVLDRRQHMQGPPCLRSIERFRPGTVLMPIYDRYRELGQRWRAARVQA